ncbi:MAG: hypothetical protein F6K09_16205 [Merismopedia sp. SIO2A8]|nr:hypothetical protein [Merismopedia sp. SIO2A8]
MEISNCPICGFPWSEPIDIDEVCCSHLICDCCGCEYGYDDNPIYRKNWLKRGAPWFNSNRRPKHWNLEAQLHQSIPDWNA